MTKPVQHINRKGKTYYLHAATTQKGKTRYVMKRTSQGALTELPDGYVIAENVNGVVSVGRKQPRLITELEEASVIHALQEYKLRYYRVEVKDVYLTIYEPIGLEEEHESLLEQMGMGRQLLATAVRWGQTAGDRNRTDMTSLEGWGETNLSANIIKT